MMTQSECRVVVLLSGEGSNLQALLDQAATGTLGGARIVRVISNRADARGLQRARDAGIAATLHPHDDYPERDKYDADLARIIAASRADLVVLAGFLRILGHECVLPYRDRMINIHPSLLPAYRGLHTHRRVLEAREREHGCSVHAVSPELDSGPVIIQSRVPVESDDTEDTLRARVQREEHRILPATVHWFAAGRLLIRDDGIMLDGRVLKQPLVLNQGDRLPD